MKEKEKELDLKNTTEPIIEVDTIKTDVITNIELTEGSERYPDVFTEFRPNQIAKVDRNPQNTFLFSCKNNIHLKIEIYSDQIIRFRYSLKKEFPSDFSYAIDDHFGPQETTIDYQVFEDHFEISTAAIICCISKTDLLISIKNKSGEIICEEDQGFYARATILKGLETISISKKAQAEEYYFGLGDKSCSLNLKGHKLENWVTDAFAFGPKTDPLYKTIPFYYGLNKGLGYGIFFDNSYRTFFDFDSEETGQVTFAAEGGEMNYYFIYGPDINDVATQYTAITGKPELPPLWALGFHQCRWSYYPEARVKEVAKEFRKLEIPCDAIYLDIDYMDEYRCFTWNKEYFPNPTNMIRELRELGFRTVAMIDPGLKVDEDYKIYNEGKKLDFFCKRPDGEIMEGPVWPQNCAFPDFTIPGARSWWGHQYAELYSKNRVAGFWNDMNEPAVFKVKAKTFPDDIRHHYEGHPCSHAKAHNIYGMTMSKATTEGLRKLKAHRRPFVITRATYSGGQRYACIWTGDNVASWEHLQIANLQCQRLSISGFSFVGSDIGGFVDVPEAELFVRWLQLGVFHPLYRVHSMGNNADGDAEVDEAAIKELVENSRLDQEPWVFGEKYTALNKYAIELRYQLLPYLYTAFQKYTISGQPMIRSMIFEDQTDQKLRNIEREFMFGDHLLVSPVIKDGVRKQELYLPKGNWYHYWTSDIFDGGKSVEVDAPLQQIPIFIREGAIIPHYPIRQNTDQVPIDELMLHVFYKNGICNSTLYEDQGDGFVHKTDQFSLKEYQFIGNENEVIITQNKLGKHNDTYHHVNLFLNGLPFVPTTCLVDEKEIKIQNMERNGNKVYMVTCGNVFQKISIQ
jgi:alpha-glucosidase